jgi:hypothetical protein
LLVLFPMVAYPFPSATTEALVDGSTERLRRLYPISTPKDDTSYVEPLSDARTPLADFFSILLERWAGWRM